MAALVVNCSLCSFDLTRVLFATALANDTDYSDIYDTDVCSVVSDSSVDLAESLDPCEKQNRRLYNLGHDLDSAFIKPVAKVYRGLLSPQWARNRVSNFFDNLQEPRIMVNSILQGDAANFFVSGFRLLVNSTIGLAGIFDIAGSLNIHSKNLGFSSTMKKMLGAPSGYYMIIPGVGPFTRREGVGWFLDVLLDPVDFFLPPKIVYEKLVLNFIVEREALLDVTDDLDKMSLDPYAMTRSVYIQKLQGDGAL